MSSAKGGTFLPLGKNHCAVPCSQNAPQLARQTYYLQNKMNEKRVWSFIGLFIIALVIGMPFYVADAYAVSLSITKNQGDDNVKGYLDADGDTWTVEATISGSSNATIEPKNVKIDVEGNEAEFNSCSSGTLGTVCKYLSPLKSGIASGVYEFSVYYYYENSLGVNVSESDSDKIKADGSKLSDGYTDALKIDFKSVKQDSTGKNLILDFSVEDQPKSYCSGLDKIEIIDSEKGVLKTISSFKDGDCDYDFKDDTSNSGLLAVTFTGEGKRWIKIKATDKLGHTKTSSALSFSSDYVSPKIDTSSLELPDFGKFVGPYEQITDIKFNVTENGTLSSVTGTSSEAKLKDTDAKCTEDSKIDGLWNCVWEDVTVSSASSISIKVTAKDSSGNSDTQTISKSFTQDTTKPKADSFGTSRTYEKVSYVSGDSNVKNAIILKLSESGSGIDEDGILASLSGLGGSSSEKPDYFNKSTYEAHWYVDYSGSDSEVLVGLYKFQDKVGNIGSMPQIKVQVDNSGPDIEKMEIYGSSSDVSDKDYFQSNDKLTIDMKIKEANGLMILVDLNDIVKDAKTNYPDSKVKEIYPESDSDYEGWMVFTEDDCTGGKGNWTCELETPSIKSGPDSSAELNIEVYDTAGNPADTWDEPGNVVSGDKGEYKIKILGLDLEENPDYWELDTSGESYAPAFIDLDTTHLINTRISATVPLTSEDAEARLIELVGCSVGKKITSSASTGKATANTEDTTTSSSVSLSRSLLYGGVGGEAASPTIVLEFEKFTGKDVFGSELKKAAEEGTFEKVEVPVTCKLKIYSEIGKKATKVGETQEVELSIPFAYSKLGAMDENIESMIEEIKNSAAFEIPDALKTVNLVLQWIRHLTGIIEVITDVVMIYNAVTASAEPLRQSLIGAPIAAALCTGSNTAETAALELPSYIQIPVSILSCNPDPTNLGIYGKYQQGVLNVYNAWSGRGLIGLPAKSLYENFYTSVIGLCVPGILYNLEKLRQVQCRHIMCLKNDVPAGIATVDSCKKMDEYLNCRYWKGSLVASAIPLIGIWDAAVGYIKSFASSPLGLIRLGAQLICLASCAVSNTLSSTCTFIGVIVKALDILDTIYGGIVANPSVTGDPYCGSLDL